MDRLPVRIRLVLAFTVVVAILLAGAGFALRSLVASNLDQAIDDGLRARASDVATLVADEASVGTRAAPRFGVLTARGERFAQILSPTGIVLDDTPQTEGRPLLTARQRARALEGGIWAIRPAGGGVRELRLRGMPVVTPAGRLVVVVGAPLHERSVAVHRLTELLLIGEPLILLLMSIVGYLVAAGALRPVDAIREQAARIPGGDSGRQLPVSRARDELSRLATTLNDMLTRMEGTAVRERRFVADASHELRSPLAVLKGELELARRTDQTAEERREAVDSAASEVDRLTRLIDDLLLVAASDEGRLPIRRVHLDTADLLERAAARARRRGDLGGREIVVDAEPGLEIDADPERMQQLLDGLFDNAIRHGAGPIGLGAHRRDGSAEISVHDHGKGFPTWFLPQAFERLSRADTARGRGGGGLGLSIVRLIAEAHGGSADAYNDDGAFVSVLLPLAHPPAGRAGVTGRDTGGKTSTLSLPEN